MATSLVTFQSFGVSASASSTSSSGSSSSSSSSSRKSTTQGRKNNQSSTGWLTPIFGWPADQPDYIDTSNNKRSNSGGIEAESGEERKARLRYAAGSFTEEKARQLRRMTTGLEMSHEKMYHSAIASRLASDFSDSFLDDLN